MSDMISNINRGAPTGTPATISPAQPSDTPTTDMQQMGRAVANALRREQSTGSAYGGGGSSGSSGSQQAYPDQGPAYSDDSGSDDS